MDGGGGRDFRVLGLVENIDEGVAILWIATSFFMRALLDVLPFGSRLNEKKKTRAFLGRGSWSAPIWREGVWASRVGRPRIYRRRDLLNWELAAESLASIPVNPLATRGTEVRRTEVRLRVRVMKLLLS